jgi:hypothetical protein
LGTLVAAGVLFVIGKAAGFLPGVDWTQVLVVAVAVVAVVGALIRLAEGWKGFQKQKQATEEARKKRWVEATMQGMDTDEYVAMHAYLEPARWNNLDPEKRKEYETMLGEAVLRFKQEDF